MQNLTKNNEAFFKCYKCKEDSMGLIPNKVFYSFLCHFSQWLIFINLTLNVAKNATIEGQHF